MRRGLLLAVGTVLAALVAFVGDGPGWVLIWEAALASTLAVLVVGRWPRWPPNAPALVRSLGPRITHRVDALEMEIMAATDPALGGEARLRRRLAGLAEHRAGLGSGALDSVAANRMLGPDLGARLVGEGPLRLDDVEEIVARLEAL